MLITFLSLKMTKLVPAMKYDFVIIDPASTEFNRGSYCYLPYILFSALRSDGYGVLLIEDFTCSDIDGLPEANKYLVGLWSYPQIDACLILDRFLPSKPEFFGYYPLVNKYRLKKYQASDRQILDGITNYTQYYDAFERILLSDCDMHLTKYEGQVYPLFTSYGCGNKCKFCPVSVNCNSNKVIVPIEKVKSILDFCDEKGYKNIHFTDEDFFFDADRAMEILQYTQDRGFNYISLGSVHTVTRFIEKFGTEVFSATGMRLIEVGLETADTALNKKMGKAGKDKYTALAEMAKGKVDIFWLTMTFFPGETIQTLKATGLFLKQYGFELTDLYGRVQTNSTKGGLGQFFQSYEGTAESIDIENKGMLVSERPVRLIPSFIPHSFLSCEIQNIRRPTVEEEVWYNLYRLPIAMFDIIMSNWRQLPDPLYIKDMLCALTQSCPTNDAACFLAISARLGVIT